LPRWAERRTPPGWKLDIKRMNTSAVDLEETSIRYELNARAYEDSRDPDVLCPWLIVRCVPDDAGL
jgi:hypothetical protein